MLASPSLPMLPLLCACGEPTHLEQLHEPLGLLTLGQILAVLGLLDHHVLEGVVLGARLGQLLRLLREGLQNDLKHTHINELTSWVCRSM